MTDGHRGEGWGGLTHEEKRVLGIVMADNGRTTTIWPTKNSAVATLRGKGLVRLSAPRPHKHYQIFDIELAR